MRAYVLLAVVAISTPAAAGGSARSSAGWRSPRATPTGPISSAPAPSSQCVGVPCRATSAACSESTGRPRPRERWLVVRHRLDERLAAALSPDRERRDSPSADAKLTLSGRLGAGIDIAHASGDITLFGNHSSTSDTDVGYAFDFAVGIWLDIGRRCSASSSRSRSVTTTSKRSRTVTCRSTGRASTWICSSASASRAARTSPQTAPARRLPSLARCASAVAT